MPSRIENVIDRQLAKGRFTETFVVPRGSRAVQWVVDRVPFEKTYVSRDGEVEIAYIRFLDNGRHMGGAGFSDFKRDVTNGKRPGQRMLWSFGVWPIERDRNDNVIAIPEDRVITVEITAHQPFRCRLHVDAL